MITVFTPSFADDDNSNAQNLTVKEVVSRLNPARFRVMMLAAGRLDERIATRANTRILRWRKRANTARIIWQLLADIPDVYFFPREGPLDWAFLTLRRRLKLKTALVTYVVSGGLESGDRPLLFRAIREGDIAVGNSRYMMAVAGKLGGRDLHTIYDGIDRRYYYAKCGSKAEREKRRVLFAGSFRRYKRAELMIREAVKFPAWEFRLAGGGEEELACRRLVEASGCQNVRFLGHLTASELGEEMRGAEIFFHPSEIEGHPQVLGQAAACGLPCVARNTYAPDYVIDGTTGMLGGSDDELSGALARLIGDEDLRRRMSSAAVEHAAKFNWDDLAEEWSQVFERALNERQNQRRQRLS